MTTAVSRRHRALNLSANPMTFYFSTCRQGRRCPIVTVKEDALKTKDTAKAITLPIFEEIHPPLHEAAALIEANRCLECGGPLEPAPCVAACPTKIDIPRFIREIADGKPLDAAATIFASNGLGGSCSRVCPVQELCEGACVMRKEGRHPVEIGRLQRYATDAGIEDLRFRQKAPVPKTHQASIGIIGAGPAGLACAEELALLGYEVTIYDKHGLPGGLVTHGIAPYKQQIDPMLDEALRIAGLGVQLQLGVEVGRDVSIAQLQSRHDAIFIGVGMGPDTSCGLPGEHLEGIWPSLKLIEEIKLGDLQRLDLGNRLVVIGGGNTAIDVAREAVRLGVPEVALLYRRDENSMPAYKHEVEAARKEGVKFLFQTAPIRFVGNNRVRAIECIKMTLGEPDSSGRKRPKEIPDSEFFLEADTVVTAIGQRPFEDLYRALNIGTKNGIVQVNETYQTANEFIFAGGDCINGGCTAVESVRHGKLAARGIHSFLGKAPFEFPEPSRQAEIRLMEDGPFIKRYQGDYYLATAAALCKGCNLCVNSCPAGILALNAKNKIEVTDVSKCVFCGMCEMRCPDFSIWIVKDDDRPHVAEIEARRRLAL